MAVAYKAHMTDRGLQAATINWCLAALRSLVNWLTREPLSRPQFSRTGIASGRYCLWKISIANYLPHTTRSMDMSSELSCCGSLAVSSETTPVSREAAITEFGSSIWPSPRA